MGDGEGGGVCSTLGTINLETSASLSSQTADVTKPDIMGRDTVERGGLHFVDKVTLQMCLLGLSVTITTQLVMLAFKLHFPWLELSYGSAP